MPNSIVNPLLEHARQVLLQSRSVAVFSGAGLSAESGLSTFRDPNVDALWSRFDPTELASLQGFEANPQRVIEWYQWRRSQHASVVPNAAHRALAAQQNLIQITQNVDHLLEQAGAAPDQVLHLHGSIMSDRCHTPGCEYRETVDLGEPPGPRKCPRCGDSMRPAVVWFGENLPEDIWLQAQRLCLAIDCLLVVGTSATVYPAAGLIALVKRQDGQIIVVDPNPGPAGDAADVFIEGTASEIVPDLLQGLELSSVS